MTDAVGVHAHSTYKLGRRPKVDKPALMLAPLLTGVVPAHPDHVDYASLIANWEMLGNDEYGNCGPVAEMHVLMQVLKYLASQDFTPNINDVYDLYKRSGNPNFPQDDNGVILQDMLNEELKGGLGGKKPVAFAKVNVNDLDELYAAVAIFGSVHLGVNLEVAQQSQTNGGGPWDYKQSGEWGGHAVPCVAYDRSSRRGTVVTWGQTIDFTDAFATNQIDEGWVVIWPEHLETTAFLQGVDVNQLESDYKQLTGKDFPVPTPPTPPTPTPPPEPTPPQPAPSGDLDLDSVATSMAEALSQLVGEPSRHVRDYHHDGKAYEKVYRAGNFQIGIIDKS